MSLILQIVTWLVYKQTRLLLILDHIPKYHPIIHIIYENCCCIIILDQLVHYVANKPPDGILNHNNAINIETF